MYGVLTYAVLFSALTVGALRWPSVAFAAVLCLYGLKQWGQSATALLAQYHTLTNVAVGGLVCVGVAVNAVRLAGGMQRPATAATLIYLLYAYAFVTVVWSPDIELSIKQWQLQIPYILTIAVMAPLLIVELQGARRALDWTVWVGTAICVLALLFGNWGFRGLIVYGSIYDLETNPLALASLAGTVVVIAVLSTTGPMRLPKRLMLVVCIPIAIAVILKSASRGQLVAAAAALLLSWVIAVRPRGARGLAGLVIGSVVLAGLGWWATTLIEMDVVRWSNEQSAADDALGRLQLAGKLLQVAAANVSTLLFGLGNSSAFHYLGVYPHITALEVLAEEGLVGGALYIAILLIAIRSILRATRDGSLNAAERNTYAVMVALFIFELLLTWKQGSLLSSTYAFAYVIILSRMERLLSARRATTDEHECAPVAPVYSNLLR